YPVSVVKKSRSQRIYLLQDSSNAGPKTGRILMLRKSDTPEAVNDPNNNAMAFRILRTYPDKNQIAAKVVRRYGDQQTLPDNASYSAIEKVSDYFPPLTPQDKADMKELETGNKNPPPAPPPPTQEPAPAPTAAPPQSDAAPLPAPAQPQPQQKVAAATDAPPAAPAPNAAGYDPELDAGTSPPPPAEDVAKPEDNHLGLTVEETKPLETRRWWITAQLGFFQNVNIDPTKVDPTTKAYGSAYYAGGGGRF